MTNSSMAAKLGMPTVAKAAAAAEVLRRLLLDSVMSCSPYVSLIFRGYFPASFLASMVPGPAPVPPPGQTAAPVW